MKKRSIIISGFIVIVAVLTMIVIGKVSAKKDINNLYAEAKTGQFDIIVTTTGELQAEKSTDIRGPEIAQRRNIRVSDIKITDLVAEGTVVKEGDYVATLDRTTFDNTLKDELERLLTMETNLEVKILDTAVTLSNLRDQIKNQEVTVEEARLTLEQSQYEPPTTIRQAAINLDRAMRNLEQLKRGYALRVEQIKSEMRNINNNLNEQKQRVRDLREILDKFVINAPAPGMIIYKRDRMGNKRKVGSSISPYDNVVATLPDMSSMISKTYVNEIDVSKVKVGQRVDLLVDAFPEDQYTGSVISVANIGEQLPNADAKVFEVMIKVDQSNPKLRPSMTTGNKIITRTIEDVTYIPLECVQQGADSIPFVYMRNGDRQIVVLGESNENNVVIENGIEPGETLFLSTPEEPESFTTAGEDLIPIIREREKLRKEEEKRRQKEGAGGGRMRGGRMNMSPEMIQKLREGRINRDSLRQQRSMEGGQRPQRANQVEN